MSAKKATMFLILSSIVVWGLACYGASILLKNYMQANEVIMICACGGVMFGIVITCLLVNTLLRATNYEE